MNTFDRALAFVLVAEGGFSDDPRDPGGPTGHGITQGTFDSYLAHQGQGARSVASITEEETRAIYTDYWTRAHCSDLPDQLAMCVFDCAVNMGPAQAVRLLQRAIWVDDDGKVGPATIARAAACDELTACYAYLTLRRGVYADLARRTQSPFLRGWMNRCSALWKALTVPADPEGPRAA